MLTLQKKFGYEGDVKKAPVTDINLEFRIPVYEYTQEGPSDPFKRTVVSIEVIPVTKKLESKDYLLNLPEYFIFGKEDDDHFGNYISQSGWNLDNFITIDVQYFIGNKIKIGEKYFEAIFFYILDYQLSEIGDYTHSHDITQENRIEAIKKSSFLINKASFYDLLKALSCPSYPSGKKEQALLSIISDYVDINGKYPVLLKEINEEKDNKWIGRLSEYHFDKPSEALIIIKKHFIDLFDFPLSIPEIKTIDLGGSFTVKTSDGSEIVKEDLLYYDLSVEYSISNEEKKNGLQAIHYDWNKSNMIQDNTVSFSFTDNNPIIQ